MLVSTVFFPLQFPVIGNGVDNYFLFKRVSHYLITTLSLCLAIVMSHPACRVCLSACWQFLMQSQTQLEINNNKLCWKRSTVGLSAGVQCDECMLCQWLMGARCRRAKRRPLPQGQLLTGPRPVHFTPFINDAALVVSFVNRCGLMPSPFF